MESSDLPFDNEEICVFLRKWSKRFPVEIDTFNQGHWQLTQSLTDFGRDIVSGGRSPSNCFAFLLLVGVWKNPHGKMLEDTISHIMMNPLEEVHQQFENALKIHKDFIQNTANPKREHDQIIIDTIGSLRGFGTTEQGSRKMVSAVLRFLDPQKYGTVDWRNWCLLSNTGSDLFTSPLLEGQGSDVERTKDLSIDTGHYLQYLGQIRRLARECRMTPAEVDMALFAYSIQVWPFPGAKTNSERSLEKSMRIMAVIDEIVDAVSTDPTRIRQALSLRNGMMTLAKEGRYREMVRYARNAISRGHAPPRAKKTLESEIGRIEEIAHGS